MARGGYRTGSGRKPGTKTVREPKVPRDIQTAARKSKMTPKEYMLDVMNDEYAAVERRDRMAIAAAPFCHARADAVAAGKKEAAQAAAATAGSGTEWGDDLQAPGPLN